MEISDYLKMLKGRLWILVLVPLLAALAIGGFVLLSPARYSATATVTAPAVVGGSTGSQYSGSNGTRAFVSNFAATATTDPVLNKVSADTGVSADDIKAGTTVTGLGTSSVIEVKTVLTKRSAVVPVATGIASETIRYLFQTQVALAVQGQNEAQRAVTAAEQALTDYQRKNGVQIDQTYSQTQQFLFQLQQQQLSLQANGNTGGAAAVGSQIAAVKAKLAQLQPLVGPYQNLVDRKTQAVNQLNTAVSGVTAARAQFGAADPSKVVTPSAPTRLGKGPELLRKVVPAIAGGLFLAVLIIGLLEVLSRRKRPTGADAAGSSVRYPVGTDA